ncbi:hypothetical protein HMI56_004255 [Coelomomyces lativittatus]|nr:hypothetical protein HMI56_004255 [Coelomomyces lativittatus]
MTMSTSFRTYELEFSFRAPVSVRCVKLTGTYDDWNAKNTMKLNGLEGDNCKLFSLNVRVPEPVGMEKFLFKFVVDDEVWTCSEEYAVEYDEQGNMNNVVYYGLETTCPNLKIHTHVEMDVPDLRTIAHPPLQHDSGVMEFKEEVQEAKESGN